MLPLAFAISDTFEVQLVLGNAKARAVVAFEEAQPGHIPAYLSEIFALRSVLESECKSVGSLAKQRQPCLVQAALQSGRPVQPLDLSWTAMN